MSCKAYTSSCSRAIVLGLLACLFMCAAGMAQDGAVDYYGGGNGDPNDPYRIWTPEQFVAIGSHPEDWASHFRLMADVNLVGIDPAIISPIGNRNVPFSGVFDGNDFAIENFTFDRNEVYDAGIFGLVSTVEMKERINPGHMNSLYEFDYEAYVFEPNESVVHIKNLNIVNIKVFGSRHVGGLAGRCFGAIENCQIKGGDLIAPLEASFTSVTLGGRRDTYYYDSQFSKRKDSLDAWRMVGAVTGLLAVGRLEGCDVSNVRMQGDLVGGLVGSSDEAVISDCSFSGEISSYAASGGLVGRMIYTDTYRSAADVRIKSKTYSGGLGGAARGSRMIQCCAEGQVEGETMAGGLLGYSFGALVSDCYAQCDVNCPKYLNKVGGFIGQSEDDSISRCYCAGQVTSRYVRYVRGGSFIGERSVDDSERPWVQASFWDRDLSVLDVGIRYDMSYQDNNYPIDEVTPLSTQAMMSKHTFTNAGWDFESVWAIEEGVDYPVLQWELAGF